MYKVEITGNRETDATKYSRKDLKAFSETYNECIRELLNYATEDCYNLPKDDFSIQINISNNSFNFILLTNNGILAKEYANAFDSSADNYGVSYEMKLNGVVQKHGYIIR